MNSCERVNIINIKRMGGRDPSSTLLMSVIRRDIYVNITEYQNFRDKIYGFFLYLEISYTCSFTNDVVIFYIDV